MAALRRSTNLLVTAVLTVSLASRLPPDPCLLKCKDNYMNDMQSIVQDTSGEWSIELVTPLQSILRATSKNAHSQRAHLAGKSEDIVGKLGEICRTNRIYLGCLGQCGESPARNALFIGQKAWTTICNAYGNDPDFTSTILPCWAEHGGEISGKCHIHAQMVQNSVVDLLQNGIHSIEENLSDLCRTITIYDKCYIWQNEEFCGEKAWQFLLQLNERSSHALVALLNSSQIVDRIPSTCQQWLAPADYSAWHKERVLAFRRQTKSLKSAPSFQSLSLATVTALYLVIAM